MELQKKANVEKEIAYEELIETEEFKSLIQRKKAFIIPMIIFCFIFYFSLPMLASYTKLLTYKAIGSITWAWVFALVQFVVVWGGGYIYLKKSEHFDLSVQKILANHKEDLHT
ncbi:DUF485 domain-containing protein [Microbacteriaceae bacterium 4G12]